MVQHVSEALLIIEARKAAEAQKLADTREFYEMCICSEKPLGSAVAKRLVAAVDLLRIPNSEVMTDASMADAMCKLEKRRYAVGVRMLRVEKHCDELSARLNAGYDSLPGDQFERLREANSLLGAEALGMKEYRSQLEHDVRDLAKFSKLFRTQPKRLEIPLPEIDEVEPCDAAMFTQEIDLELGIRRGPDETPSALADLLNYDVAR